MPIYPSSGLLDAFTRANENPIDTSGANLWSLAPLYWIDPLKIVSNRAATAGPGVFGGMSFDLSLPVSTDVEAYVSVSVLPTVNGDSVELDMLAADSATPSGYVAYAIKAASGITVELYRLDAGAFTQLGSTVPVAAFVAGDGFLLQRLSTGVALWTFASGAWSATISDADTTYYASALIPFLGANNPNGTPVGTTRMDFFGGGIVGSMVNLGDVTATDIGSIPASLSQDVQQGYVANRVWFKYTAVADQVIGLFGYGSASIYTPQPTAYLGPAGSLTTLISTSSAAANKAIQLIVRAGLTYFFDWQPANTPNLGPAVLLLDVVAAPNAALASGQIFVNDDTPGFPAVFYSPTGAGPQWFWVDAPAGEAGDILTDGRALLNDFATNQVRLYDMTVKPPTLLVTLSLVVDEAIRAQRVANVFYVGVSANPVLVKRVDRTGAITGSWTLTGNTAIFAIAANNSQTVLYFSNRTAGSALKRWDLGSDTALSNLVGPTTTPPYYIEDILVLMDDTLLVSYVQVVFLTVEVRHYDSTGTLLRTYGPFSSIVPAGTQPRLAYALDDPVSFWLWTHEDAPLEGFSRFRNIRVSDGSVLQTIDQVEYEGGIYQPDATPTPDRFGNSFSCPFFILSSGSTPPTPGTGCPNTLTVTAVSGVGCSTTLGSSAV